MILSVFLKNVRKTLDSNAPEILTALGIAGIVTTSYLVGKASFTAASIITANENEDPPSEDFKERLKERARHTWQLYIPAGVSGAVTVGCILGASKAQGKRTAAAVTAYSLSELAFNEYRDKVVEQIGKGKEQKLRDEIAQERVSNNPPNKEIIVIGSGNVLCCELFTGRYFRSDMEALRKAQNDINLKIVNHLYVTLEEFYDLIGLSYTTDSGKIGWDSNKLMELQFSTVLSENGEPCLAFEYNYTKPLK